MLNEGKQEWMANMFSYRLFIWFLQIYKLNWILLYFKDIRLDMQKYNYGLLSVLIFIFSFFKYDWIGRGWWWFKKYECKSEKKEMICTNEYENLGIKLLCLVFSFIHTRLRFGTDGRSSFIFLKICFRFDWLALFEDGFFLAIFHRTHKI